MSENKLIAYWLFVAVILNFVVSISLGISFIDCAGLTSLGMVAGHMGSSKRKSG